MKKSLTARVVLWVTLGVTVIFSTLTSYDYFLTRTLLDQQLRQATEAEVSVSDTRISNLLTQLQHQTDLIAEITHQVTPTEDKLKALITAAMDQHKEIQGMAIIVEPHAHSKHPSLASHYYRENSELRFIDLSNESYAYREKSWYKKSIKTNQRSWTEPYVDHNQVLIATYLSPIEGDYGRVVVTLDMAITDIQRFMTSSADNKKGLNIYTITPKGHVIDRSNESLLPFQLNRSIENNKNLPEWYPQLLLNIENREAGSFSTFCPLMNEACWISYAPLGDTDWTLLATYSHASLTDQLMAYTKNRVALMLLGISLLAIVIWFIVRRLIMPLRELDKATLEFGKGKLDYSLPALVRNDEIGSLSQSFTKMQSSLQHHIEELKQETQKRERLNSELRTASQIQLSLLPNEPNMVNKTLGIDLSAYLKPARTVGGDLYYYDIEGRHLLRFVIGDVSDKGIAAAIFMARVVTAITAIAEQTIDPADMLTLLNRQLEKDNDACMFVTVLSGTLDLISGELKLASAGHPMPFHINANNEVSQIEQLNGPAIGLYEYAFETLTTTLEPNSYLFAYTDGLDEAENEEKAQYGEERILSLLKTHPASNSQTLISTVISDVSAFVGNAEPADDLTLLAIHWSGPKMNTQAQQLLIDSRTEELAGVNAFLNKYISQYGLPESLLLTSELVIEELIVNTINYGYTGKSGRPITISLSHDNEQFNITVTDQAKAFNPLELDDARLGLPEADEPVGGLGVHLVKEMCHSCHYEHLAGENRFTATLLFKE